MRKVLWVALAVCVLAQVVGAATPDRTARQGPIQVGDVISLTMESPSFTGLVPGDNVAWREELSMPGASYIAIHFRHFKLPPGAVLKISTPDGSRSRRYEGYGKSERLLREGFWATHMPGDTAIIELLSRGPLARGAVVIDQFAHGYPKHRFKDWGESKAICGTDDSRWARCYETSEPEIYSESRAVARLLMNGSSACTGWLVGDEGHLMTNEHCIGNSSTALNTDYELMAEGSTCSTNCASWFACPGTVVADSATLIQVDAALDYSLVRLPTNPTGTYGYMQLRESGAVVNERMYIPGHPAGWGKRFAVESTASADASGYCEVYSLDEPPCSGGPGDTGYYCDTQGGSSGSPVLGYSDHCVISLHHCANCPNRGVPIEAVISDLGGNLPNNALCGGCTPQPTADAGPDQTICLGDSTTIGTPPLAGHSYSWSPGGYTSAQPTVSPTVDTTYTVTATTVCGSAQDSVTVFIDDGTGGGLTDDFEGGGGSWTTSGLWHLVNNSSCASPGYASPTHAMYYGQDSTCTYNTGSTTSGDLISPEITGIKADSTLSFNYFRQVESYAGSYDRTEVAVSVVGSSTWTTVWSRDSQDASENAWTASGDISLASFAGEMIQVRFRFDSVDSSYNDFIGWFIDDVVVTGESPCGGTNTPPTVTITGPPDGSSYTEGDSVTFTGTADDAEDGDLTASLAWTSSLDGAIGSGGSFATSTLSVGIHTITASVTDSGGLPGSDSIQVTINPVSGCPAGAIDFSSFTLTSYADQNVANGTEVLDGGDTLRLYDNTWVRSTATFSVTANTVIDFDFASSAQGEIHAIGFDENDTLNDLPRHFQFWGTQNWTGAGKAADWSPQYSGGGAYQSFSIPVGQYYTGSMWLVFTNDNDAGSGNEGLFKCVRIYETTPPPCDVNEGFESGAGGWINSGSSTCTTGTFVAATPTQVVDGGVTTQPAGAQAGSNAWFTATNSSAGVNDVDGGVCITESPVYDVTVASDVSVWYFHGQRDAGDDPSGDYFYLEVSINGGAWTSLASYGDVTSNAAWTQVTTTAAAGDTVQFRVRVSDGPSAGDLVEGGVDSITICEQ